jgi:hypothetical protein
MRRVWVAVFMGAVLVVLPSAAGQTRVPPEHDGSTYTWPDATTVTVDVEPWGSGFVQSTPYLIDCPLACIRPFDQGREVTFTARPTSGFTFASWIGPCEGQPNPCTLTLSGATVDVGAVFTGRYIPPPPAGPRLALSVSGDCPGCTASAVGTGFHPNSSITLSGEIISPPGGTFVLPGLTTTDATGTWSYTATIPCDFGSGPYVGPFVEDVTATDAEGASASGRVTANCVTPT